MKCRSPRFWRAWQLLVAAVYITAITFMLFCPWYSRMVGNSRNPRLVHTVCFLGVTIPSLVGILVLGRKFSSTRARVREDRSGVR